LNSPLRCSIDRSIAIKPESLFPVKKSFLRKDAVSALCNKKEMKNSRVAQLSMLMHIYLISNLRFLGDI